MSDPSAIERVRTWCAAMPAAVLEFPFGDEAAVYKIGGKMFALATVDDDPGYITLKVDPDDGVALRAQYDFIREGYYMNKRHWITVDLVPNAAMEEVQDLISESHLLVAAGLTKAKRSELGIELP